MKSADRILSNLIGGNPGEWHPRTAHAVLVLVEKIEFLEDGHGWRIDENFSAWTAAGALTLRKKKDRFHRPFKSASSLVLAWLSERPDFDHDDPRPEDLPAYPPGD